MAKIQKISLAISWHSQNENVDSNPMNEYTFKMGKNQNSNYVNLMKIAHSMVNARFRNYYCILIDWIRIKMI